MNKLLIVCFAMIMSCTHTTAKSSIDMQTKGDILASESQGGTEQKSFKIIKDQHEFESEITKNFVVSGREPMMKIPAFPRDKKIVLYNLGTFNSGDHKVSSIKSISVKNNILYVEVPEYDSGGMAIQVMSNPWLIFSVPSNYQFNSVELIYSK